MNKTWLLFDNGLPYSIDCVIHPMLSTRNEKADAYVVPDIGGDLSTAAVNAATATYDCLINRNETIPEFVANIKLLERTNNRTNIEGDSGGLIFTIAIAKALLKKDLPDIAATGIIQPNGVVKAVGGLDHKLLMAADRVGENGYVFYPKENQPTIPNAALRAFKKKKIHLSAVSHIDQAFDVLMLRQDVPVQPSPIDIKSNIKTKKKKNKTLIPILLFIIFIGLLSFGAYYLINFRSQENSQELKDKNKEITKPILPDPKPKTKPVAKPDPAPPVIKIKPEPTIKVDPEPKSEPKTTPSKQSTSAKDTGFE